MINKNRLLENFIEMVKIPSPSLDERKMADYLRDKLEKIGMRVIEDDTGSKIGGNAGNIIAVLDGNTDFHLMFSAHMDTVTPCENVRPIIKNGRVTSSGDTILGADDKAGIAAIIEGITAIKESGEPHPTIMAIFSVAEETRLLGATHFDHTKYNIKYGFILDSSGKPGTVVKRAPYHDKITISFIGRAAHAGIEPEKGINALYVASHAISKFKMGRIDENTTFNLGIVSGGRATNIVMEEVLIVGEARSFEEKTLGLISEEVIEISRNTAEQFKAGINYEVKREYDGFSFSEEAEIIKIVKESVEGLGMKFETQSLGGGSDTNVYNSKGVNTVNLGIGMSKPHAMDEYVEIVDIESTAEIVLGIIKNIEKSHKTY